MKHITTFENFLTEASKEKEVYKGLEIGTKYPKTDVIKKLGFELTDDEDTKKGDLVWDEYTGKLDRLQNDLSANQIKNTTMWKVKEITK